MEDYFEKTRNGHMRIDCYDPDNNTLDINSGGLYPSNVLSNMCDNSFEMDGVRCMSMEGFLQSLKYSDHHKQVQICGMKGGLAKRHSTKEWINEQKLWWHSEAFHRQSCAYDDLVRRAYLAMFQQNHRFRCALLLTAGIKLVHEKGRENKSETILTASEFCSILMEMRDESEYVKGYDKHRSRKLAYLLRHDRKHRYDKNGWREVDELIASYGFTMEELCVIVALNNKKRFEFSDDYTHIRARQGHSVSVDVELQEMLPPDILYHGTAQQSVNAILKEGLKKGNRMHVHLSADPAVAEGVGQRHGVPMILKVNAKEMREAGIVFYFSRNGVWLTDYVDPKYIMYMKD